MSKQLKIKDPISEQEYTLEFNRKSILRAIDRGFDPSKLEDGDIKTMMMLPELFNCAFDMHHGKMDDKDTDAIYEMIPNKEEFIGVLAELFADPIEKLFNDPKGAKSKNFKWKKTW